MGNFTTLYGFELKKILKRRMIRITFVIILCIIIAANISSLLISYEVTDENGYERVVSGYEELVETREAAKKLMGRLLDDALLSEMSAAYKDAASQDAAYREIYNYVINYTNDMNDIAYENAPPDIDEAGLYQIRQDEIEAENDYWALKEGEISYWAKQEEMVEKPFRYEYHRGASLFFARINLLRYLWIFFIAICLAGSFSEEHVRRTDQITLCSRHGKLPLYLARIAAGVTFGVGGCVFFYLMQLIVITAAYGTGGYGVQIQFYLWMCSRRVSIGEAIMILFLCSLIASIACSAFTMLLSEALHNGIATLALIFGLTLFTMFVQISPRYRFISQFYSLLPVRFLNETGFLDKRLFSVFGRYVTGFVTASILYLIASIVFIGIGYRIYQNYQNYQVDGR